MPCTRLLPLLLASLYFLVPFLFLPRWHSPPVLALQASPCGASWLLSMKEFPLPRKISLSQQLSLSYRPLSHHCGSLGVSCPPVTSADKTPRSLSFVGSAQRAGAGVDTLTARSGDAPSAPDRQTRTTYRTTICQGHSLAGLIAHVLMCVFVCVFRPRHPAAKQVGVGPRRLHRVERLQLGRPCREAATQHRDSILPRGRPRSLGLGARARGSSPRERGLQLDSARRRLLPAPARDSYVARAAAGRGGTLPLPPPFVLTGRAASFTQY